MIIRFYGIELQTYHNEIVGRLQFTRPDSDVLEQSGLYSLSELNNLISLWQDNALMGSFAIGTTLAPDATFALLHKGAT